jgi:UDP-3-O-[3-hydroxymyristoyl] glucosamine N-acyltransferase
VKRAARRNDSGSEGGSVLTAAVIAELTGGELLGDAQASVSSVAPLDRASEGQLSFCATGKYATLLADTGATVVLVAPEVAAAATRAAARIVVKAPHDALVALLPKLYRVPERVPGIHPSVAIGRGARIGADAVIGPFVHVGDGAVIGDRATIDARCVVGAGAQVGDDVHLFPGVTLYPGVSLGSRVLIHASATIGSDGFGYISDTKGHRKIPHVGGCFIADDVEIGAGTTIDRGSVGDTMIGAGTKIDNLVQVGHNARIGRLCMIAAQAGISGSITIEDGVIIGGQAGFQGHHTIGARARIGGQSGVFGDVPSGETWSGYPARPHRESLRATAALFRLAGLLQRIERMLGADKDTDA